MSTPTFARSKWIWIVLFSVAMAQLEAAVVVYLRQLYYPDGFRFPLVIIEGPVAAVEIGREVATVIMIVGVAQVAFAQAWRRFAVFLVVFGVWDIFYYVWLKVMLGWPESLFTNDILFLIPLPWTGPVLSAAAIALIMVVAGTVIEWLHLQGRSPHMSRLDWGIVVASAIALLAIFMWEAPQIAGGAMPGRFPWAWYALALAPALVVASRAARLAR